MQLFGCFLTKHEVTLLCELRPVAIQLHLMDDTQLMEIGDMHHTFSDELGKFCFSASHLAQRINGDIDHRDDLQPFRDSLRKSDGGIRNHIVHKTVYVNSFIVRYHIKEPQIESFHLVVSKKCLFGLIESKCGLPIINPIGRGSKRCCLILFLRFIKKSCRGFIIITSFASLL